MAKSGFKNIFTDPIRALQNKTFAKLYASQTISLLGDSLSWVGLALLSYQINADNAPIILATALTLRVTAFIIFSPFAGVLADKIDRKKILYVTHLARMVIICCFPFITSAWQIYALVFLLNIFNAFFAPTYRSVIPLVTKGKYYREAVGLSVATYQLLGILGPGLAGIAAVAVGVREIFFIDGASFILAALLIFSIPASKLRSESQSTNTGHQNTFKEAIKGIRLLFSNKILRFALGIEFIAAISGSLILVNTIIHVKNVFMLSDTYYGWAMAAFGIGAAISAFVFGSLDKTKSRSLSLISGSILLGASICFANFVPYSWFIILWLLAGLGQSLSEMPSQTLVAENISPENQGKVYGSHFAVSHFWWVLAYPIAGFLGTYSANYDFMIGGVITLILSVIAILLFKPDWK